MNIYNDKVKLEINESGEISSIKFMDIEMLHQGEKWWGKTFPMIWPNLAFSSGFEVEGKEYKLPKHGFWKELDWEWIRNDTEITLLATHFANDQYPFSIDIQCFIKVNEDNVVVKTKFTNMDKKKAYFHFGLHPAFKIDKESQILTNSKQVPFEINKEGNLTKEQKNISKTNIMDIPFAVGFDTLTYKDVDFNNVSFKYNGIDVTVGFDSNNLQLWKPQDAEFICIEPWYGWNDYEYKAPADPKNKKEIIELNSGKSWISLFSINFEK